MTEPTSVIEATANAGSTLVPTWAFMIFGIWSVACIIFFIFVKSQYMVRTQEEMDQIVANRNKEIERELAALKSQEKGRDANAERS